MSLHHNQHAVASTGTLQKEVGEKRAGREKGEKIEEREVGYLAIN